MRTRILFVEDDPNLGMLLKENLDNKGFETIWCKDGNEGITAFKNSAFGLCILDVMMPVKDGFILSKEIRAIDNEVPIIFLTARGRDEDKIKGFEHGADDYVTKPFSTQELYMRINAVLKRAAPKSANMPKCVDIGKYRFDYNKMTLQLGNDIKRLSSKEAELIQIFVSNKNELVQRTLILERVWGNDDYFAAKSMDVYMSKIRKLFKDDPGIEILNAYGIGFKLIINS
ncbi:MAG: response regulator transcription factor [Bacteroidetes bacterium]|nr:response regulator transcription factor [Bacteroidota bacterium]